MEVNGNKMKPGIQTTEFAAGTAGTFLSTLIFFLAAFNIWTLTEDEKRAVFMLSQSGMVLIPTLYIALRTFLKKKTSDNKVLETAVTTGLISSGKAIDQITK